MTVFSYQRARDYLDEIIRSGIKYDLNNIRLLLKLLDHPERNFPVLCIAGTNGKGSTAAFLESILTEAGYRVGLNTSPHLVSPRERLRINRVISNHEEFAESISTVGDATLQHWHPEDPFRPTFFETMTSASLVYFREKKIDIALMEAGLGGRLDASNALYPIITVITRIGLDHPKTLGNTLKKIAFEKFGLARANRPLIVAHQRKHVLEHLRALAAFRGTRVITTSQNWKKTNGRQVLRTNSGQYTFRSFGIPGSYQRENVATAVSAAEMLRHEGFTISDAAIQSGIENAFWPGRMEFKDEEPRLLLDGSHNTDGINSLVKAIRKIKAERKILVYAKVGERSPKTTIRKLIPLVDHVLLPPLTVGRAVNPEELQSQISKFLEKEYLDKIEDCSTMAEAWQKARQLYKKGDLIIVAGSLYLVGEFKAVIGDGLDARKSN